MSMDMIKALKKAAAMSVNPMAGNHEMDDTHIDWEKRRWFLERLYIERHFNEGAACTDNFQTICKDAAEFALSCLIQLAEAHRLQKIQQEEDNLEFVTSIEDCNEIYDYEKRIRLRFEKRAAGGNKRMSNQEASALLIKAYGIKLGKEQIYKVAQKCNYKGDILWENYIRKSRIVFEDLEQIKLNNRQKR